MKEDGEEKIPSGFLLLLVTLHGVASVLCQQLHVSLGCCCCFHSVTSHKKRLLHKVDIFRATGISCFSKCWTWFWPSYRNVVALRCCWPLGGCWVILHTQVRLVNTFCRPLVLGLVQRENEVNYDVIYRFRLNLIKLYQSIYQVMFFPQTLCLRNVGNMLKIIHLHCLPTRYLLFVHNNNISSHKTWKWYEPFNTIIGLPPPTSFFENGL